MDNICILATGGTIDKDHDPISEELIFSDQSYVPAMLSEFRTMKVSHDVLMLKDSLDMNDSDREAIKEGVLARPEALIVVTHGTSTMPETAAYLSDKIQGKTVVLTGAMRPFSLFRSDAGFNLGTAIAAVQLLEHGVYITMNGQIFKANDVQKNIEQGRFERKS